MSFSREILIIGLCAFASLRCNDPTRSAHVGINRFVIEAEELVGIMNDDSVAILDLRKPEQFEAGHLPNSVNIWRNELQNDSMPYGGVIARKEQLESVLGSKGISNGQFLAMYDDRGSCEATRLWWILNFYGYEKMAILNGGINAWQELQSVTKEVKPMHSASFSLPDAQKEESIIYLADLVNRLDSLTVIDTRTHLEFRGEKLKAGALHKGRIPGSIHADWMIALDTATNKFKPINELEMIYKELLQSKNSRIVTYCHSGVRSSHTFFVLTELLGYREVQNFDGSWLEWTYHDLPRENDPIAMQ
ncbi:MAG: sulfurtransferase [Ekhidna sp.]|nr:sulfurtransferase [Ekhidna sp.]